MYERFSVYWTDDEGSSAAEFAIVALPFIALVLAILWLCLTVYGNSSLQNAAEDAARCASVRSWSSSCDNAADIEAYAQSVYKGPAVGATFTYSATGCGHTVTGAATIPVHTGLYNTDIALSASACFP